MSNIGSNICAGITCTLGIFGMKNEDFSPTTVFIYLVAVICAAFVMSFAWEWFQDKFKKWVKFKVKQKDNDMGLGNGFV